MSEQIQVGRLAMRQEGGNWNAYYAETETMKDAIFLGSIKMSLIIGNPELKANFIDLMRTAVSPLIAESVGVSPNWKDPIPAPEHERSGNA